jgi:hypothetical protein
MTSEERAQLVEDIRKSNTKRQQIVERAEKDPDFDLLAAWEDLDELDASIAARIKNARNK